MPSAHSKLSNSRIPFLFTAAIKENWFFKFLLRSSGNKNSMKKATEKPKGDTHKYKEVFRQSKVVIKKVDDRTDPNIKGVPIDYSFRKVFYLSELKRATPREYRVGIPKKSSSGKYISSSLLANYNHLTNLQHVGSLVNNSFHTPEMIAWLDVSFNNIDTISNELLDLRNLKILYLHGNQIRYLLEVVKLKALERLRTLTLHGNPIEEIINYRATVVKNLPQLINFDFSLVTRE